MFTLESLMFIKPPRIALKQDGQQTNQTNKQVNKGNGCPGTLTESCP